MARLNNTMSEQQTSLSPLRGEGRSRRSASPIQTFKARITIRTSVSPQRGERLRVRGGQSRGALREESGAQQHPLNLFTFTGYRGFDPERGTQLSRVEGIGYPHLRNFTATLDITSMIARQKSDPLPPNA